MAMVVNSGKISLMAMVTEMGNRITITTLWSYYDLPEL